MITTTIHRADPKAKQNGERAKNIANVPADLADEDAGAYLVDDGIVRVWLPKCQVTHNNGIFTMPEWLARERRLI